METNCFSDALCSRRQNGNEELKKNSEYISDCRATVGRKGHFACRSLTSEIEAEKIEMEQKEVAIHKDRRSEQKPKMTATIELLSPYLILFSLNINSMMDYHSMCARAKDDFEYRFPLHSHLKCMQKKFIIAAVA